MFAPEHRYSSPDDKSAIDAAERRPVEGFFTDRSGRMSGVAGRSGRKRFVPTPEHRDLVKVMDTILGRRPVNAKPIKNERLRVTLAIFVAKVRLGWTVANYHQQVRGPIDEEHAWQRLDAKIARLAPRETGDFPAGSRPAEPPLTANERISAG